MPSKFPSDLSENLYSSDADDEYSGPDGYVSWWGIYRLDERETILVDGVVGVILHEDNQGFVYEYRFRDERELESEWEDIGCRMAAEHDAEL